MVWTVPVNLRVVVGEPIEESLSRSSQLPAVRSRLVTACLLNPCLDSPKLCGAPQGDPFDQFDDERMFEKVIANQNVEKLLRESFLNAVNGEVVGKTSLSLRVIPGLFGRIFIPEGCRRSGCWQTNP